MPDNNAKYQGRKWKAFVYVMAIESLVLLLAAIKMVMAADAAMITALVGFMVSCFGAINISLGFYFVTNVAQKKVIGKPGDE